MLSVMVIVIGNEIRDLSSNPGKTTCISLHTNALEKSMNPSLLPSAVGKQLGRLGSQLGSRKL